MSTDAARARTQPASRPAGYKAGDYIPFADRDPSNPSSIAGQWADPARQAQMHGQQAGRPLTPQEQYRAIYGYDAPERIEFASWGRRVLGYLVDTFLCAVASIPLFIGYVDARQASSSATTDPLRQPGRRRHAPTSAAATIGDPRPRRRRSRWPSASGTPSSGRAAPATRSARRSWASGWSVSRPGSRWGRAELRAPARALRRQPGLLPRLAVAAVGQQEPDPRRQDHEHRRRHPAGRTRPASLDPAAPDWAACRRS